MKKVLLLGAILLCSASSFSQNSCQKIRPSVGYLDTETAQFTPIVDNSSWHNIVMTKNNLNGKVYLDGKLITDSTFSNEDFIWNSLLLGATQPCIDCYAEPTYIGSIDEVRVSSIARTETEIQNNFKNDIPLSVDENTIGLFHFDTPSEYMMKNSTNSNDGILFGGVKPTEGKFGLGLNFDGIDDYARFTKTIPVNNVTVEFWFKTNAEMEMATMAMLEYSYNTGIYISTVSTECEKTNLGNDTFETTELTMYPNPVADLVLFNTDTTKNVRVFDMTGKELINKDINSELDVSNLVSGVYLCMITDGDKVINKRIIKK
jgi:hypothetical protein